jgi:hypothetical protein
MTTTSYTGIESEQGATGLLIATYVFGLLGGFLGIICGFHVYASKLILPDGTRVHKFKKSHRLAGLMGGILGIVSLVCWKAAMN